MAAQSSALTLDISIEQLQRALLQLPVSEKIRIANQLRAAATAEKWRLLSEHLPNVPELTMADIVSEVKAVRRGRKEQK